MQRCTCSWWFPLFSLLVTAWSIQGVRGQVVLSEASASNGDWVEIRNDGSDPVNLAGHTLADDFEDDEPWAFGEVSLQAGERLVVHATGNNQSNYLTNWTFPVLETDFFRYSLTNVNPDPAWVSSGFDDSSWGVGQGGFGYGDGDDNTLVQGNGTLYLRTTFNVANPDEWDSMTWAMDVDDGYIAYLNGEEFARSDNMIGVGGNATDFTIGYTDALLITGGMPEILSWDLGNNDGPNLVQGDNVLAIQVHNANATSSDMTARPFLGLMPSETSAQLFSVIPEWWPVTVSLLEASFKLSPGETVVLRDPQGEILDALPIHPELPAHLTVGRPEGSTSNWCIFEPSTYGVPNGLSTCYSSIATAPSFDLVSGLYASAQQVNLTSSPNLGTVRYTLNGSEPTGSDALFPESGLTIEGNTVMRARTFGSSADVYPSVTEDATYIVDGLDHEIPVVSLMTAPENLFDWNTGIYELGPNASDEYPYFGANFWQPWSRSAWLHAFDANGALLASEGLDLEIHGGWSRAEPQKSFRLDFKGMYTGDLEWPLFLNKPWQTEFNNINLRNGGQHFWSTRLQDAVISDLTLDTYVLASSWRPVEVYLNGEYWGLYGAREKSDEHFVAAHFDTDAEDVILLNPTGALNGDPQPFEDACNTLLNMPFNSSTFMPTFESLFNAESYMDYFIIETFFQNTDWMGIAWGLNNTKVCRPSPEHRWEYILYDTDACLGYFGASVWDNYLALAREPLWPSIHSELFNHTLNNLAFRHRFVNRYADLINTLFQTDSFMSRTGGLATQIEGTLPQHIARWQAPSSLSQWDGTLNNMFNHLTQRITSSRSHLMSNFGLPFQKECTLNAYPTWGGEIRVNTITPGPLPWTGVYFGSCPIELEVTASTGYYFTGWEPNIHSESGDFDISQKLNVVDVYADDEFRANFLPCPLDASLVIVSNDGWLEIETTNVPHIDSIGWFMENEFLGSGESWLSSTTDGLVASVFFDGCTVSSDPSVIVSSDEHEHQGRLTMAPNPASQFVDITPSSPMPISIWDTQGRLMHTNNSEQEATPSPCHVDVSEWSPGVYHVKSGNHTSTLVVTRAHE